MSTNRGQLPEYLVAMVRRRPPERAHVVAGSTPVVSFGDPSRAEVATLGINPSAREFVDGGVLLGGERRRLATLESLGADRVDQLSASQVRQVIAECGAYFHTRPYRAWFDPLDNVLRTGLGVSYYDGSACHLDLVQWATDPVWGKIPGSATRAALLEDGVPHLRAQLARENVRLILLNGRQVIDQVTSVGLADLTDVGSIPFGQQSCRLLIGTGRGVRWLGWSTNLQSSRGVSAAFKRELANWIASISHAERPRDADDVRHSKRRAADDYLPRGERFDSRRALVKRLESWLRGSTATTIGDVSAFAGKPWIVIKIGTHEVQVNADTKRSAVETFVRTSRRNPDRPWRVVAGRGGNINKVVPNPDADPVPGWYAYLVRPLQHPRTI